MSRNRFFRILVALLAGVVLLISFQNCGVRKPSVESLEFKSASYAHTGLEKSCAECHTRPTSQQGFTSFNSYAPYDYSNHGAKLDCIECHSGMTKTNRVVSDWSQSGYYMHSSSLKTCNECHTSQRPRLMASGGAHPTSGECISCHSGSLTLVADKPETYHIAMDVNTMWKTASAKPTFLTNDPTTDVSVYVNSGSYNTTSGIFTDWQLPTPQLQTIKMEMNHMATIVGTDMDACYTCHANSSSYVGARFHKNVLAQPTSCLACHDSENPNHLPKPVNALSHDAFIQPLTQPTGSVSKTLINHLAVTAKQECATCHTQSNWAQPTWKNAYFHRGNNTVPPTCNGCHSPARPTKPTTSGYDHIAMSGTGECAICHNAALSAIKNKTAYATNVSLKLSMTDWKGASATPSGFAGTKILAVNADKYTNNSGTITGKTTSTQTYTLQIYHSPYQTDCATCHTSSNMKLGFYHAANPSVQLTTCKECHLNALPGYVLGAPTKPLDHAHVTVTSKDCSVCHATPTATLKNLNFKDGVFHSKLAVAPTSCKECHSGKILDQPIWKTKDHSKIGAADCLVCHSATGKDGTVTNPNWLGATGVPLNYLIPNHVVGNSTISGFMAPHTIANSNCTACHGTSTDYKAIRSFDHQQLPADKDSCIACHFGTKASVGAFVLSTSPMIAKMSDNRHHKITDFARGVSCIGCHTPSRGAGTFNTVNGVTFPAAAKQAYISLGCGSVNATTYSCHESGQRTMRIPVNPGTATGNW